MGDVDIDRLAVDIDLQMRGNAVVVQRLQQALMPGQHRAPAQQRVAVALGRADRIGRGEGVVVIQLARQPGGLVLHAAAALDHFLQRDHVRRQLLELSGDIGATRRPVFAVVMQVERD
ncbi:hypothetical protein FHR64_000976 [Xanthomonas arboricola]|nr:hypothetical protein [Xanthomonas arboricola]